MSPKSFSLFSQPYLDRVNECYLTLITINTMPQGPIREKVVRVKMPPLSEFKEPSPCAPRQMCALALRALDRCGLMTIDDLPNLMSYLTENNYEYNKGITNVIRRNDTQNKETIAFITYKG